MITEIPVTVTLVLLFALVSGAFGFVTVNSKIFNLGLSAARGEITSTAYVPYLVLFAAIMLVSPLLRELFTDAYAEPRCQLVLRTVYKGKMLQKLKSMKYEHLESEAGMETR
jgi:ATP-binding cassette subfamily B protein